MTQELKYTRRINHYLDCPYLKGESEICTCGDEPRMVDERYLDRMTDRIEYEDGRVEFRGWAKIKGRWRRRETMMTVKKDGKEWMEPNPNELKG